METFTSYNEQNERLTACSYDTILLQNVSKSKPNPLIRSGPKLNDCEVEALCSQVVAELPPEHDFTLPPGFELSSEDEESLENYDIVERAFIRTNINEAGGFKLKFEGNDELYF